MSTTADLTQHDLGKRLTITHPNGAWSITGKLYDIEHTTDWDSIDAIGTENVREDMTDQRTELTVGPFEFTTAGDEHVAIH